MKTPVDYVPGYADTPTDEHGVRRVITFGSWGDPPWSGPDDPDPIRRAARIQDQVARTVRRNLREHKVTQTDFAQAVGLQREKLNRLISGSVWASIIDLERMLGGCGATMSSVSWAIGDGSSQSPRVKRVIAAYLHEQLAKVEGDIARTEQEHSSN